MRWLLAIAVASLATPAFAQENEAEKLFRQTELKVRTAKTVQVRGETTLAVAGMEGKIAIKIVLAEGDKLHMDLDGNIFQQPMKITFTGDGTKVYVNDKVGGKIQPSDNIRGVGSFIRGLLPRGGLFMEVMATDVGKDPKKLPDLDEAFHVSDFKMVGKEKLGDRAVQVIQFKLKTKHQDDFMVKLWIDAETLLPSKFQADADKAGAVIRLTETYSEYTLNGKVDPKLFEAPK